MSIFSAPLATLNRVEISAAALRHNQEILRTANGSRAVFPVLKANAYGHGIREVAQVLSADPPPYFCVDSYHEAQMIWRVCSVPVLLLGGSVPSNLARYDWRRLTLSVGSLDVLRGVVALGKRVKIHLAINTGMNREGFQAADLPEVLQLLAENKQVICEGTWSHFADADGTDDEFTRGQEAAFTAAIDALAAESVVPHWVHLGNSAGCLRAHDSRINAVRAGIASYGFDQAVTGELSQLRPTLRVISTVTSLQQLRVGEKVSYNCTWTAERPTKIATLPIGYFELLDRRLSNCACVTFGNKVLPLAGRVCMNLSSYDATGVGLAIGDEVVVLSDDSRAPNSVVGVAELTGTIPYEVLTRVSGEMRRVVM